MRKILKRLSATLLENPFGYAPGPLWPWVIASAGSRRLRQKFEISHGVGTMTHRGPNTVVSSVTAANDDDVLASGINISIVLEFRVHK